MRPDSVPGPEHPAAPPDHRAAQAPFQRRGRVPQWVVLVVCVAWLRSICPEGWAQASPPQERRWLLAIETSRSMAARKAGLYEALRQLFQSGFDGRLRPGDSIGVWTFDREVYTGQFPLQTWAPERGEAIVRQLHTFLDARTFQNVGQVATLLSMAEQIANRSASFTLILFCTGGESIAGTPFDRPIYEAVRDMRSAQRRIRQPVIIVLRAEQGRWVDYAVGQPPWPVRIPATSIERQQELETTFGPGPMPVPAPPSHAGPAPAPVLSANAATPPPAQTQSHLFSAAETGPTPTRDRPAQLETNTRGPGQPVETLLPGPTSSGSPGRSDVPLQSAPSEAAAGRPQKTSADATPDTNRSDPSTAGQPMPALASTTPAPPTAASQQSRPPTAEQFPVVRAPEPGRADGIAASADLRPDALPSPRPTRGTASPGSPGTAISPSPEAAVVRQHIGTLPVGEATSGVAPADRPVARVEPAETKTPTRPLSSTDTPGQTPATNKAAGTLGTATPPPVPRRTALLAAGLACLLGAMLGTLWLVQRSRTASGHGSLITHSLDRQPPPSSPNA